MLPARLGWLVTSEGRGVARYNSVCEKVTILGPPWAGTRRLPPPSPLPAHGCRLTSLSRGHTTTATRWHGASSMSPSSRQPAIISRVGRRWRIELPLAALHRAESS